MIDLHTHILPGVDDGVDSKEEAAAVARDAVEQGGEKIVATPHYLADSGKLSVDEIKDRVQELQQYLEQQGIEIEILPGMEIYLTQDLGKKAKEGKLMGLNDSKYLLIELPMNNVPQYTENVLHDLRVLGYQPVIAHPERYREVIKDPNLVYDWVNSGALAQLNGGSLLGMFGSKIKETSEILVEHNLVQLVASDLHSNNKRKECLEKTNNRLSTISNEIKYWENAKAVTNGENVVVDNLKQYEEEKGIMDRLKLALGF
ncbi:tyrosine-protein phosphatase [Halanaerobacter jeridensis]|uniref:protein-tyrosine-phosphatase n=1 Tax=Halanaerobacter jeridensis TaxID=706427 RepID=A0A938XPP5_9FIRM|nr:CpsB/CapC family capsule biosynthesis tyrosine phosphatase [Halanaerobacter jeridensis]MBM7556932.1 protein-tyrosine phosphatase [Halanaerobacter jeridensis]